jgi:uncharacterized protein
VLLSAAVKVIVTGSHGLIGGAVVSSLEGDGHQVTSLVRPSMWDPAAGTIDAARLEGHDAVVHLAGAGIGDARWTPARKAEILRSRVDGTLLLARALAGLDDPPAVLASGSAVGYYGDRGDEELTESSGPGQGFLAGVVRQWEEATGPASAAGIRVVHLRTGVVLSPRGGALAKLLPPFRLGLGGRFGSGRQWFSWVTLADEVAAIRHVLENARVAGPVNVTAPSPVTNASLAATLGRVLGRPTVLPTPVFAVKLRYGAELVDEMLLSGQRVLPAALTAAGFRFGQPELEPALRDLLGARG